MTAAAAGPGRPAGQPVDRRTGLSEADFREQYGGPNRPVVLEGAANAWGLRWTPEIFRQRFGDRTVRVMRDRHSPLVALTMRELVDSLTISTEYRYTCRELDSALPELGEDLRNYRPTQPYFGQASPCWNALWMAPRGNQSQFHHDGWLRNFNSQIHGRKRFILSPPGSGRDLHVRTYGISPVDPLAPDLRSYPRFARARLLEAVLAEGDVLYIPPFWFHFAHALTVSININTFFSDPRDGLRACWLAQRGCPLPSRAVTTLWLTAQLHWPGAVGAVERASRVVSRALRRVGRGRPASRPLPATAPEAGDGDGGASRP